MPRTLAHTVSKLRHILVSRSPRTGRPGGSILAVVAVALLTTACASQPPGEVRDAATDAGSQAREPEAAEAPPPVIANPLESYGGKVLGEPGEQWLTGEDGYRYFLVEIAREPYHKILPNGYVMLPPGAAYELDEEREDTLVVRLRDSAQLEASRREARKAQPGRAEMVADLVDLEIESGDRLQFRGSALSNRGQWRQGFELVDMNGDGHLDLVHGPIRKGDGRPKIFLGDGDGGWRPWREARFESQPLDYGDIAVADFDGDGALDLALAIHLRGVVVLRGDGEGTFTQWGEGLPYWYPGSGRSLQPYSSRTIEAVDWDRDGRPDLLTLGEGPRLIRESGSEAPDVSHGERGAILFLNRGDGRWERYDQGTRERQIFGDGLAVGDFNGDGLSDFAVASNVSGATKIVKLGTEEGGWEDVPLPGIVRPGTYGSVHAADLDGDGRDELLLGFAAAGEGEDWFTGIDLVEMEDGEWRRTPIVVEEGNRGAVTALATGDLDQDGHIDVVALTGLGDRWILLGTGAKTFRREESTELVSQERACQGFDVAMAPVGSGGSMTLIMGFAGESGSETIIPTLEAKCPSEGSLEVWTVAAIE